MAFLFIFFKTHIATSNIIFMLLPTLDELFL